MNAARQVIDAAHAAGTLRHYFKTGTVRVRPAVIGERVDTIIGGKLETTNRAAAGDVVVTGAAGERYILTTAKLKSRYAPVSAPANDDGRLYQAVGDCWAVVYNGPAFSFTAPWGEAMRIDTGDYMCTTAVGSDDVYRIERGVFERTYRAA